MPPGIMAQGMKHDDKKNIWHHNQRMCYEDGIGYPISDYLSSRWSSATATTVTKLASKVPKCLALALYPPLHVSLYIPSGKLT